MDIQKALAGAKKAVETLYDKKATIKRHQAIIKTSGADGMGLVTKHTDVPCRLSSIGLQTLNNTTQGTVNTIQYTEKLFLSSSFDVVAGDVVIVNGVEYELAKEPFVYISHQEVLLVRKGYA
jgi:repressor of nif and glnA expression